jgi:hypothetical protein
MNAVLEKFSPVHGAKEITVASSAITAADNLPLISMTPIREEKRLDNPEGTLIRRAQPRR